MIIKRFFVSVKAALLNNYRILFREKRQKIYRNGSRKSRRRTIFEDYIWLLREKSFNSMYNAFGLDIKGTSINDYIGKREFLRIKAIAEKGLSKSRGAGDFDYRIVTKDKFYATSVLKASGVPCIENIALISGGKYIGENVRFLEPGEAFGTKSHFVLKNVLLEAGEGVYFGSWDHGKVKIGGKEYDAAQIRKFLGMSKWIVQDVRNSGADIRRINDTALNITRIVTVYNGSDVHYLSGYQCFATQNHNSDSWDKGAVYVGIDSDGNCLRKEGYFHPGYGTSGMVLKHPDSGIVFDGYSIAYLKDSVDLCIKAHHLFSHLFVIGWDVVITDEGPEILEVNEVPGLNAIQCIDGGIRKALINYSLACCSGGKEL